MKTKLASAFVIASMLLLSGCGTDDVVDDIVDELDDDYYDYDYNYGDVSDHDAIYIYKNVSSSYVNSMKSAYSSYDDFEVYETDDSASCRDYGFSSSNKYSSNDGYGGTYSYYTSGGDICYEYDYKNYGSSSVSGNNDVIIAYDY